MSYIDKYNEKNHIYGVNLRESRIQLRQKKIGSSFFDSPNYYEVAIYTPSTPVTQALCDVWITDNSDLKEQKNIISYPEQLIEIGYLVYWKEQDSYWLTIQADSNFGGIYSRGSILKCVDTLKWIDDTGEIQETWFAARSDLGSNFGITDGRFIPLPNERRHIYIQNNEYTEKLEKDQRFIFDRRAWRIVSSDRITSKGIIILTLEETQIIASDNVDLRIAEYVTKSKNYTIQILNPVSAITLGQTYQVNAELYSNDVLVTDAVLTYSTSDPNVSTVNSSGLVTAIATGNVSITVSYENAEQTLPITIQGSVIDNQYVVFESPSYIYLNETKTFTVHYENNGVSIADHSIFSLYADDGISSTINASIVSQDSVINTCTIKASNKTGYVKLKVQNLSGTIVSEQRIQIKSFL